MSDLPVIFRAHVDADLPFVFDSWIRSFEQSENSGPYSRKLVVDAIRGTIKALLDDGAQITVACFEEDPNVLAGFVCFETRYEFPVVHYVYCKDGAREAGLGSALVEQACQGHADQARYTFRTGAAKSLLPRGKWRPRRNRHL